MDRKTQMEVKNLQKIGLPEDLAMLCAGVKTGNEEIVNMVLSELSDEQEGLKGSIAHFTQFAPLAIESGEIKKIDETEFVEVNQITGEKKIYRLPHDTRKE